MQFPVGGSELPYVQGHAPESALSHCRHDEVQSVLVWQDGQLGAKPRPTQHVGYVRQRGALTPRDRVTVAHFGIEVRQEALSSVGDPAHVAAIHPVFAGLFVLTVLALLDHVAAEDFGDGPAPTVVHAEAGAGTFHLTRHAALRECGVCQVEEGGGLRSAGPPGGADRDLHPTAVDQQGGEVDTGGGEAEGGAVVVLQECPLHAPLEADVGEGEDLQSASLRQLHVVELQADPVTAR